MITVQTKDFDIASEYETLRESSPEAGAIVTFTGLVRELTHLHEGKQSTTRLTAMELEHYPAMTQKALSDIEIEARKRWDIDQVRLIHRVGQLKPQDQIVFVGVSSAHRRETFSACEFIMDFLKTRAPFWKKEITTEGGQWVEARESDDAAAQRWDTPKTL